MSRGKAEAIEREATALVSEVLSENSRRQAVLRSVVTDERDLPVVYAHHKQVADRVRRLMSGDVLPDHEGEDD